MIFKQTKMTGAYIIELEKKFDSRGFFARSFCLDEFGEIGLKSKIVQQNLSLTLKAGTLRGMHFQKAPYEETKVIRCTKGKIYDVIIDLRRQSKTHKKWLGIELSEDNRKIVFVPEGFAHGFVTLVNNCEVSYLVSEFYNSEADSGVRFNDPAFNISWPAKIKHISLKDKNFPDYKG